MIAIIKTGGKQYKVAPGDVITVEKLDAAVGETVKFEALLVSDAEGTKIGSPIVEGAEIEGKVLEHGKGKKIIVFKYKPKKNYRKKQGHRQPFTRIEIESVAGVKAEKKEAKPAAKSKAKVEKAPEAAEKAAEKKPAEKKPAAKKPAEKKPAAEKTAAKKPAAEKKPAAKKETAKKAAPKAEKSEKE